MAFCEKMVITEGLPSVLIQAICVQNKFSLLSEESSGEKPRGIDLNFCTWNLFVAQGKHQNYKLHFQFISKSVFHYIFELLKFLSRNVAA